MFALNVEQTFSCDEPPLAGLSASEPEASLNLHLIRFLIDRSKRRNAGKSEVVAILQRCNEMLEDIARAWRSCMEGTPRVSARALYEVHVLMSTIERLIARMSPETEDYLRLHRCVVLLDEVDRTLEKSVVSPPSEHRAAT